MLAGSVCVMVTVLGYPPPIVTVEATQGKFVEYAFCWASGEELLSN